LHEIISNRAIVAAFRVQEEMEEKLLESACSAISIKNANESGIEDVEYPDILAQGFRSSIRSLEKSLFALESIFQQLYSAESSSVSFLHPMAINIKGNIGIIKKIESDEKHKFMSQVYHPFGIIYFK
jgi:hypothetical protein